MTSTKRAFAVCHKNGKRHVELITPGTRGLFWFDTLADAGVIRVLEWGEENLYFEFVSDEGFVEAGYCKCL